MRSVSRQEPNVRAISILASFALASAASASPPPPPPPVTVELSSRLVPTPTAENFASYAGVFAGDLTVMMNGKIIASSKSEWLSLERSRLGKVDRVVLGHAEGHDNVLVLDRFDDRLDEHCPSGGLCVFDPRYHVRAIRYQVGADRLIHAIQIVESEGLLQTH
jgi:hypothetical protein